MRKDHLSTMIKGWFVGDFDPTVVATKEVEVAVKYYQAGDYEALHHHKIATEITVIVQGSVKMNGVEYHAGDIVTMEPGESTDFLALTTAINVVVKLPSAKNDKYLG